MYENMKKNHANIEGEIASEFVYSHEAYGEKFFTFDLKSPRFSGENDYILVTVSERMLDVKNSFVGKCIRVQGQARSYNKWTDGKSKLIVTVFAKNVEFIDSAVAGKDTNSVVLEGYICTKPVYRRTPKGRNVADWIIGVGQYEKSYYIPCIAWERNAYYVSSLPVGSLIRITGRMQSRKYMKAISETEQEERIAYEFSANTIELVKEAETEVQGE